MLFHVLMEQTGRIRFSPAPEVDKLFFRIERCLFPGLPLEALERYVGRYLASQENLWDLTNPKQTLEELQRKITGRVREGLKKAGSALGDQLVWQDNREHSADCRKDAADRGQSKEFRDEKLFACFLQMMEGRQIAEGEITFWAKDLNFHQDKMIAFMHKAVIDGQGKWVPAVIKEGSNWRCQRCGSVDYVEWPSLYGQEATCRDCRSIGALNSLQVLFRLEDNNLRQGNQLLSTSLKSSARSDISLEFSSAQCRAAEELLAYMGDEAVREVLVWAACGAGKTEVCFPLLSRCLSEGKQVLFAAPRQDVVLDIQPRLQRNFPQYRVGIWSGATLPERRKSQLTVATTHQIFKFYQAFDLILFDEIDAYPYAGNKILEFGMGQALRENGQMVYLTATPSENLLRRVRNRECALIHLPARFHGHPIPVPEVMKSKLPEYYSTAEQILKSNCLSSVKRIVEELVREGPLLVFVPIVAMVQEWVKVLHHLYAHKLVEGSWSTDPDRRRKVSDFISGRSDIFVCTSILERGITVGRVQVLILYAQHELYDVRTLIQMAGRTGRTVQAPYGRAIFIAPKKTKPMFTAIEWIQEQNALAGKEGFLDAPFPSD